MKRLLTKMLVCLLSCTGSSLTTLSGQVADTLGFADYLAQVKQYHPLAVQANTFPLSTEAELLQARGSFDPILSGKRSEKTYGNTLYYNTNEVQLKLPLAGILDVTAGQDYAAGNSVNPESKTGAAVLTYAGLTLPVLRGLIYNERRAQLLKAKLLPALGEAERQKQLNKLLLVTAKAYWQWWQAWHTLGLIKQGMQQAETRYQSVKQFVQNGDRGGIDTTEALLELLRRRAQYYEGSAFLNATRLGVESNLWSANLQPDSLNPSRVPQASSGSDAVASVEELVAYAHALHPEVVALEIKLKQLRIDSRLSGWNRLPYLDFSYRPYLATNGQNLQLNTNYRWGLSFSIPLLFRKERGGFQLAKLKYFQSQSTLADLRRAKTYEVLQKDNEYSNLEKQVTVQQVIVKQSERLLAGEEAMFTNGESSLFLINQRERALLDAKMKHLELQSKYVQAKLERLAAAGIQLDMRANAQID